jgi:hypothetical protein
MPTVLPVVNALALDAVPLKVPVIVPVEKPPLLSLLTIVFAVLSDVADNTDDATVVIVDEITPPTLFTVGASAEPPKSLANFKIPFAVAVASGADEFVILDLTKAVVAICVELLDASAVIAVGVPVNAGLVDKTTDPVPVELLVRVPPFATVKGAVKVNVPDNVVFDKVGVFENTKDPVPTSFVTAADKFALVGEAKNV